MAFDDILKSIGEFGPYQKRVYILVCLPSFVLSALLVIQVFILGTPEHRCKLPGYNNDTFENQSYQHTQLIQEWIPRDGTKNKYDRCYIYHGNGTNSTEKIKCTEWVYDKTVYKQTFASKLNMVCDDAIKIPNAQMIFFFGVLTGSLVYGQLSDIIGRRKTMYICLIVQLGSSLGLLGMDNYIGFCFLMFLLGGATLGVFMTTYVIGLELVGPDKRVWTGGIVSLVLTSGQMYLILMVYLLRDWKFFTLAAASPAILFLPYYWLIPESCRWLLSKNRKTEALAVLRKVAKSNKTVLDEKAIESHTEPVNQARVWQLFSTRTLTITTLVLFFNWFVCSMSYYGVVLNTSNLGGDLYLNFVLMTVVEYPAKLLAMFLLDKLGRKKLHISFLVIGGISNIVTIWPIVNGSDNLHYLLIGLAMLGKLCITGAFAVIYVLSAELFPTVVRTAGVGACSAVARVGTMVAPYVAKSADLVDGVTGKVIPMTLFGFLMFLAGLLTLYLPETLKRDLPQTIKDMDEFRKHGKKKKCVKDENKDDSEFGVDNKFDEIKRKEEECDRL